MLMKNEKLLGYTLVNFYEFTIGSIMGLILNEISYKLIPYSKNENILLTGILTVFFATVFINLALYLRHWVEELPILSELSKKEDFVHPPPIALTFGFWITQRQLKFRNRNLQQYMFNLIGSPGAKI